MKDLERERNLSQSMAVISATKNRISLILTEAGMFIHELPDDASEIYSSYREAGFTHTESPYDTYYVMDGEKIVHIGCLNTLLSFANKQG